MTPFFPSPSLAAGYLLACVLLAATPGADMTLFLSRTLAGGRAQGFAAQAGANAGLVIHTFAAALGLSALLAASADAYQAVKIMGALYLIWLAYGAIRHGTALETRVEGGSGQRRGAFLSGLLINLTNPKIVLFFVTFLPQFIDAGDPHAGLKLSCSASASSRSPLSSTPQRFWPRALRRRGEAQSVRLAAVRLRLRRADERLRGAARLERGEIGGFP